MIYCRRSTNHIMSINIIMSKCLRTTSSIQKTKLKVFLIFCSGLSNRHSRKSTNLTDENVYKRINKELWQELNLLKTDKLRLKKYLLYESDRIKLKSKRSK